jgi:hypothetical protein
MLGVSMARVYQLIKSGELSSIKQDLTVLVSVRSCDSRQMQLDLGERDAA